MKTLKTAWWESERSQALLAPSPCGAGGKASGASRVCSGRASSSSLPVPQLCARPAPARSRRCAGQWCPLMLAGPERWDSPAPLATPGCTSAPPSPHWQPLSARTPEPPELSAPSPSISAPRGCLRVTRAPEMLGWSWEQALCFPAEISQGIVCWGLCCPGRQPAASSGQLKGEQVIERCRF